LVYGWVTIHKKKHKGFKSLLVNFKAKQIAMKPETEELSGVNETQSY